MDLFWYHLANVEVNVCSIFKKNLKKFDNQYKYFDFSIQILNLLAAISVVFPGSYLWYLWVPLYFYYPDIKLLIL